MDQIRKFNYFKKLVFMCGGNLKEISAGIGIAERTLNNCLREGKSLGRNAMARFEEYVFERQKS